MDALKRLQPETVAELDALLPASEGSPLKSSIGRCKELESITLSECDQMQRRQRITVGELVDAYVNAGMPTRKMRPKRPATGCGLARGCRWIGERCFAAYLVIPPKPNFYIPTTWEFLGNKIQKRVSVCNVWQPMV